MHTEHTTSFLTSDLGLAAALCIWVPIESIDKSNPRRAVFGFLQSHNLNSLVELYWRGQLEVEPQAYFAQLRALKSRLHETD